MDLDHKPPQDDACNELITRVVSDLYSFSEARQTRILDSYYFPDCAFVSPMLATRGVYNLRRVFLLWKALNKHEPTIHNVCFDGNTCVVFLTQNLSPRMAPCVHLQLPVITTLSFRETDLDSGLIKIARHEESWTIDGILKATPFVSFWYENVLRALMGRILSTTGKIIHTTTETVQMLAERGQEIDQATRQLAQANAERARVRAKTEEVIVLEGTKVSD